MSGVSYDDLAAMIHEKIRAAREEGREQGRREMLETAIHCVRSEGAGTRFEREATIQRIRSLADEKGATP